MTEPHDLIIPTGFPYGLTKREYFAGEAMKGLLTTLPSQVPNDIEKQIAQTSTKMADALIEQLNKSK